MISAGGMSLRACMMEPPFGAITEVDDILSGVTLNTDQAFAHWKRYAASLIESLDTMEPVHGMQGIIRRVARSGRGIHVTVRGGEVAFSDGASVAEIREEEDGTLAVIISDGVHSSPPMSLAGLCERACASCVISLLKGFGRISSHLSRNCS